ncbi:MAG: ribosome biogenesis GTPase YlqF [Bacilli bacterium]|jgi:ribosome biogenesis GTPase A
MSNQIHWFPGHMKKALQNIEEKTRLVDIIIEIIDARAPLSSHNPFFDTMLKSKPVLIVLSKNDLADETITGKWIQYYEKIGFTTIAGNLTSPSFSKKIGIKCEQLSFAKREKEKKRGMKPQPVRVMVLGIPNVGKSTLINTLTHSSSASVQNKPGLTRSEQWIRISKYFDLLDTPGILPMRYDDEMVSKNVALIGCVKQDILPIDSLSRYLLNLLQKYYPGVLQDKYKIDHLIIDHDDIFNKIACLRGCMSGGKFDITKAQVLLLNDFKNGYLGRISIERL